jgi:hypothetical protein
LWRLPLLLLFLRGFKDRPVSAGGGGGGGGGVAAALRGTIYQIPVWIACSYYLRNLATF